MSHPTKNQLNMQTTNDEQKIRSAVASMLPLDAGAYAFDQAARPAPAAPHRARNTFKLGKGVDNASQPDFGTAPKAARTAPAAPRKARSASKFDMHVDNASQPDFGTAAEAVRTAPAAPRKARSASKFNMHVDNASQPDFGAAPVGECKDSPPATTRKRVRGATAPTPMSIVKRVRFADHSGGPLVAVLSRQAAATATPASA